MISIPLDYGKYGREKHCIIFMCVLYHTCLIKSQLHALSNHCCENYLNRPMQARRERELFQKR